MKNLYRPAPLGSGDKVALVAPSGPLPEATRLDFALDYLKDLGLFPICGQSCFARHGYMAGEDWLRAHDINWAFEDVDIKGIFCIRGGYGAGRILDALDYEMIHRNPKFFCGYSDVTALHTAINQKARLMTFHTPMLCEAGFTGADAYTTANFNKCMFKTMSKDNIVNPPGHIWEFLSGGRAEGPLCGGNLSVITSLLGTPYEIDTNEKILFLEDVGEEPYKVDRMLNQMRMAGKFDKTLGIIFGSFTDCEPNDASKEHTFSIPEIIDGLHLNMPVLYGFACGHCTPTASLPLGAIAVLDSITNCFEIKQI